MSSCSAAAQQERANETTNWVEERQSPLKLTPPGDTVQEFRHSQSAGAIDRSWHRANTWHWSVSRWLTPLSFCFRHWAPRLLKTSIEICREPIVWHVGSFNLSTGMHEISCTMKETCSALSSIYTLREVWALRVAWTVGAAWTLGVAWMEGVSWTVGAAWMAGVPWTVGVACTVGAAWTLSAA
jgi:hypothetical protein